MNEQDEANRFFYIIHDDIPEILMRGIAFRRVGRQLARDIKVINCPYCNKPLTEVSKDTKIELYRYPSRKHVHCHAYPTCGTCKNEVGIILA